jgi:putative transposase
MSISNVVGKLKSLTASALFREYPEVQKEFWGGNFWQVGSFVSTSGDQVTTEIMRNYIEYHKNEEKTPKQLKLF